jgi:predicted flap endonuclease-1-like 5' DNA nuclease
MRRTLSAAFFALVLSGSASASHYMIADVPDVIPAARHAALAKQGIENTAQLFERVVTKTARAALAKATGIGDVELTGWARTFDLMQLNGIGPKMVRLLNASGVTTLAAFQKADATALYQTFRSVNVGSKYSEVIPPVDVIAGWIDLSRKVPLRLE